MLLCFMKWNNLQINKVTKQNMFYQDDQETNKLFSPSGRHVDNIDMFKQVQQMEVNRRAPLYSAAIYWTESEITFLFVQGPRKWAYEGK